MNPRLKDALYGATATIAILTAAYAGLWAAGLAPTTNYQVEKLLAAATKDHSDALSRLDERTKLILRDVDYIKSFMSDRGRATTAPTNVEPALRPSLLPGSVSP